MSVQCRRGWLHGGRTGMNVDNAIAPLVLVCVSLVLAVTFSTMF